jgi:drug/metabolite transporter (DMT)-like permease
LVAREALAADWPVLKRHLPYCFLMGAFGYTGFNALFYAAGHHTTAINIAILQGCMPVVVIIVGALVLRERASAIQWVGAIVTLLGVAAVASGGDLAALARFTINFGDVLILIASLFYAAYTVGLRKRPAVSGLGFFAAMAGAATATSVPLAVGEYMTGHLLWPSLNGWLLIGYIAFGPSLLSQLMFMRGVQLIGPVRAGLFINLVPVLGAIFAVIVLGEQFGWHHGLGLVLVLGGIFIAEQGRKR